MSLDLRQLQHFVSVASHGSYAQAAQALNLTQPTLSRSIQALERQIGGRLLDRGRSGSVPTELGNQLLRRATELLRLSDATEQELRLVLGLESGYLRIGTGAYAADISVGRAAARFAGRHPSISIDVSIDDWTEMTQKLLDGSIDVAIAESTLAAEDERLEVEPLPVHPGVLFCRASHPLAVLQRSLTLEDIARFPFAAPSLPPRLAALLAASGTGTPGGSTQYRADTFELIRRIVLESNAVAAASRFQLQPDIDAGRVKTLPLEMPGLHSSYGVIRLAGRTASPSSLEFISILREVELEVVAAETSIPART